MVKQAGKKRVGGGNVRRKSPEVIENGQKKELRFVNSAKRALAFRRFWVFLLAFALVMIGLVSAVGARLF